MHIDDNEMQYAIEDFTVSGDNFVSRLFSSVPLLRWLSREDRKTYLNIL